VNIFKRLELELEREALKLYLERKHLPMSLVSDIIAAFTQLETSGTATVGPVNATETVTLFGQKIEVTESATINLKKV